MIPVKVREEEMDGRPIRQSVAKASDSAAGVEDYGRVPEQSDFDARSISAEAKILGDGSGDGAANSPECQLERIAHLRRSV
jgi:hypothetical protein